MKLNDFINRAFKAVKKLFQPVLERIVIDKPKPEELIPKHETKTYHNPPSGKAKGFEKKRRAAIRQQKLSRRINRKAA
jgi:hypothetical protein